MKIITASLGGFCFGVKRAVKLAEKAANKGKVFSLGPLIHNRPVIQKLSRKGVRIVNDLKGISKGQALLIRSHGAHPKVLSKARKKGIKIIDATCPFVNRCQRLAKVLLKEGYRVIVFGNKNHSEVKSIVGFTGDKARVVAGPEDLPEAIKGASKAGLLSQTTQSKVAFGQIVTALLELVPEVKIFNTICQTAIKRQEEAKRLSQKVEMAIVVGGKNSANTDQLASIFKKAGIKTHHIEDVRELKRHRLNGHGAVAVMAGASTPDWITKEIINYLKGKK